MREERFMFRRTGKNPLEKEITTPLYPEENAPLKYSAKKSELPLEAPQKLFEDDPRGSTIPHHFQGIMKEEPETTLGEGVVFRGELSFERLLRIDGVFEGELISQGKVIVGPKGKVKANLNLREAIIEGKVEGNITVSERLELRGAAVVHGDIEAKLLSVDEGVTLLGRLNVQPGTA
jgi:cytoskeletal protein CcmA (bactofilin family)